MTKFGYKQTPEHIRKNAERQTLKLDDSFIINKYEKGCTLHKIAGLLGVSDSPIIRILKIHNIHIRTRSEMPTGKKSYLYGKIGPLSHNWKGDNVSYRQLHKWINKYKPRLEFCEMCKKEKPYDVANISGKYKRDINDYEWLCRKCHMIKDGRLKKFKKFRFKEGKRQ